MPRTCGKKIHVDSQDIVVRKAFPTGIRVNPDQYDTGMDLRDYFAAQALASMKFQTKPVDITYAVAKECYAMADAMMRVREE